MDVTTIGIDLAKLVLQVHAVDAAGSVVVRKALRRAQVLPFFAKLPPCLVGMEACGTSHHWARELVALGHTVKMMPPAYVKSYVKRGKTDAADAEANRPNRRLHPTNTPDQQIELASREPSTEDSPVSANSLERYWIATKKYRTNPAWYLSARSGARWSKAVVVTPEERDRALDAQPSDLGFRPSVSPAERLTKPLCHQRRHQLRTGRQVDRAIEVQMAELVGADVEVHPVHPAVVVKVPMHAGLDLRPYGNGVDHGLQLALQQRRWGEWPFRGPVESGVGAFRHENLQASSKIVTAADQPATAGFSSASHHARKLVGVRLPASQAAALSMPSSLARIMST